jgi:hypothetical protein
MVEKMMRKKWNVRVEHKYYDFLQIREGLLTG